jgi:hypothetical protein
MGHFCFIRFINNISLSLTSISMDLAHFDAVAFARPARRPMVVVRLPNTGYRGCKGVVKFLGSIAGRKVARRGAPPNVRAYNRFFNHTFPSAVGPKNFTTPLQPLYPVFGKRTTTIGRRAGRAKAAA